MKIRLWYVAMGITAAAVFYGMIYLGHVLCVPMENAPCVSMLNST